MSHARTLSLLVLSLLLAGCHIRSQKNAAGNDNVDIGTPFGSMHVQTADDPKNVQTGLTPYPGATVVNKDGDDSGGANVNMSFGSLKLGVHAVDLQTADPVDKVLAFYRKDMARYGTVITCKGNTAVGTPVRTGEGLTCSDDNKRTIEIHTGDHLELRAGSPQHQHIVSVHSDDGATRIGVVALELPGGFTRHGGFTHHDASDRE